MDKYQKALLEIDDSCPFYTCTSIKNSTTLSGGFNYDEDVYILIQEEDIFSTKYEFVIKANSNIEACTFLLNGDWYIANKRGKEFYVELDIENRIEKIKLSFADNIVDTYIFSLQYVETDKELYYKKQEAAKRVKKLSSAQIKYSTGADLVNIYFQPCDEEYAKTEIELWIAKGIRELHHGMLAYIPKLIGGEPEQMIAKYSVEEGINFKSITGLAQGVYGFKVKQFDKDSNLLFETEFMFFEIKSSNMPTGRIIR